MDHVTKSRRMMCCTAIGDALGATYFAVGRHGGRKKQYSVRHKHAAVLWNILQGGVAELAAGMPLHRIHSHPAGQRHSSLYTVCRSSPCCAVRGCCATGASSQQDHTVASGQSRTSYQVSPPFLDMASASGVRSRSLSSKASRIAPLGSVMACTCQRGSCDGDYIRSIVCKQHRNGHIPTGQHQSHRIGHMMATIEAGATPPEMTTAYVEWTCPGQSCMITLLFGFGSAVGRTTLHVAPPSTLRLLYIGTPCSRASRTSQSSPPAQSSTTKQQLTKQRRLG
jgi:hypothetical protein